MRSKKTIIGAIIMFMLAFMVVVFGAQSFAKYVYQYKDELLGNYVDFRLTISGDSQTAVMYERPQTLPDGSQDIYQYEGIIPLKIVNEKDGEISQRDIEYEMVTPSDTELQNKQILDAWGDAFPILPDTRYYNVSICDELGNEIDITNPTIKENLLTFKAKERKEVKLYLSIKRLYTPRISGPEYIDKDLSGDTEHISLALKTTFPYKSIKIINIKVANSLVIIDPSVSEHFKFNDLKVDIKTSKQYVYEMVPNQPVTSLKPTKIVFTIDKTTMFDKQKFIDSFTYFNYLNQKQSLEEYTPQDQDYSKAGYKIDDSNKAQGNYTITLYLETASSLKLHFYVSEGSTITAQCYFKNPKPINGENEYNYTNVVAGIKQGKVYPFA